MSRIPIVRAELLAFIDMDEATKGYRAGFDGDPEPSNDVTYSYWHGWRNGAVDSNRRPIEPCQSALAKDAVLKGYVTGNKYIDAKTT
jgi:hypothetical protein